MAPRHDGLCRAWRQGLIGAAAGQGERLGDRGAQYPLALPDQLKVIAGGKPARRWQRSIKIPARGQGK